MANKISSKSANYPSPIIPVLKDGSKLAIKAFHRRYEVMPREVNTELIKGVTRLENKITATHATISAKINSFLGLYSLKTSATNIVSHATYFLDRKNVFQPDCVLRIKLEFGGKSWVNDEDYLEGSPELIVEIAASTASYDLHDKLEIYEQKSVQEYIVWRVLDKQIDWFNLEDGKYHRLMPNKQGIIESKVFAGLRLNIEALLEDDLPKVLADLQKGINSKKYKEFTKKLIK